MELGSSFHRSSGISQLLRSEPHGDSSYPSVLVRGMNAAVTPGLGSARRGGSASLFKDFFYKCLTKIEIILVGGESQRGEKNLIPSGK